MSDRLDELADLDDTIRKRIQIEVRAHELANPHVTEDQVRAWIAEAIAGTTNPTPTLPALRLPDDRLIFGVDPNRADTMNHKRHHGQAWAAANMFQLLSKFDHIAPQLPEGQRKGYGLKMGDDGAVHSWVMADGTTVRYGPIVRHGQTRFRLASQFRGVADGYVGQAGLRRFSEGREVPSRGWQIDTAIRRDPGFSDARTFDGTRSGLSGIGANIAVGVDAPAIVWGFEIEGNHAMHSGVSIASVSLHEPGHKFTGPIVLHFYRGQMVFGGKRSKRPDPLDYHAATQSADMDDYRIGTWPAPMPGERKRFVMVARVDRSGRGRPLFELWEVTDQDMVRVIHSTEPYGYEFTQADKTRGFYPIVQNYLSGAWAYPGSAQVARGMLVWNHAPDIHVYSAEFGAIGVSQDCTAEEMGHHLLSFPI